MDEAKTQEVLAAHLDAFAAADADAIADGYAEDAVLITPDGTISGKAALRDLFAGFFQQVLPKNSDVHVTKQMVLGETAYIVWNAVSPTHVIPIASDTFCVRDGKIVWQTFVATITKQ